MPDVSTASIQTDDTRDLYLRQQRELYERSRALMDDPSIDTQTKVSLHLAMVQCSANLARVTGLSPT